MGEATRRSEDREPWTPEENGILWDLIWNAYHERVRKGMSIARRAAWNHKRTYKAIKTQIGKTAGGFHSTTRERIVAREFAGEVILPEDIKLPEMKGVPRWRSGYEYSWHDSAVLHRACSPTAKYSGLRVGAHRPEYISQWLLREPDEVELQMRKMATMNVGFMDELEGFDAEETDDWRAVAIKVHEATARKGCDARSVETAFVPYAQLIYEVTERWYERN